MRASQDRAERQRLLTSLLRPKEGWVDLCRTAVADNNVSALLDHKPYWEAFGADEYIHQPVPGISGSADSSARALISLARALTEKDHSESFVREALHTFNTCGLTSPSAAHEPYTNRTETSLDRVLQEIELLRPGNPSADFTALLARHLHGHDLKVLRRVEIPVLFDLTRTGSVGYLAVSEIADGPAGLHPSPASMSFLAVNAEFQRAIADAWALAPKSTTKRSFIWEITDATTGDPVRQIAGASLGLAWFAALDAFKLNKAGTLFRLKKIDPLCAVTGRLEDGRPGSVEGYENKISAAEEQGLRIVYPSVDRETAEPIAVRLAATATPVEDLPAVIRAVRNRPNPTAKFMIAAVAALFVGILVTGAAFAGQLQRASVASDIQNLINQSQAQLTSDPRKAALYALAADRLGSNGATRENIFNVAAANPNIAATVSVADESIRLIRANDVDDRIYVLAGDNTIIGYESNHKTESWRFQADTRVTDLTVTADGKTLMVLDEHTIKTYDLRAGTPTLAKVLAESSLAIRDLLRVYFFSQPLASPSSDPSVLVVGKTRADVYPGDGGLSRTLPLTAGTDEEVTTSANDLKYIPAATDEYRLTLSTSQGRVLSLNLLPLRVAEVSPKNTIPGTVFSMETQLNAPDIVIGTSKGVYAVTSATGTAVIVPSLSVHDTENVLATRNNGSFDGGLAMTSAEGLTVEPIFEGSSLSFRLPRTNDRHLTSLAKSGEFLVAGDVGGRLTFVKPGPKANDQHLPGAIASAIAFSPDGNLFAADASSSPMRISTVLRLNPANSGTPTIPNEPDVYRIAAGSESIYVNAMDAGSEYLAVAGQAGSDRQRNGTLILWKRGQQQPIKTIDFSGKDQDRLTPTKTPDIVTQVKLFEKKNLLAAYNIKSGRVSTFRLPDLTPISTKLVGSANRAFSVSPDKGSLILLSGTDFTSTGRDITLQKLSADDLTVAWSMSVPNAMAATSLTSKNSIAVLEDAQTLAIRNDADGKQLQTVKLAAPTRDVVGSPDGELLTAIQQDGTAKILSTSDFKPTAPPMFDQHKGATVQGIWSPDGKSLAGTGVQIVGGKPGATTYTLWDLSPDAWQEYLCAVAGSDLTTSEWSNLQLSSPRPTLCEDQR
jgi:hypothetical protein